MTEILFPLKLQCRIFAAASLTRKFFEARALHDAWGPLRAI